MSYQASAWYRHTRHYLGGIDPALEDMFVRAMRRAGFPGVTERAAFEAVLADFLAGYDRRAAAPEECCPECGDVMNGDTHPATACVVSEEDR